MSLTPSLVARYGVAILSISLATALRLLLVPTLGYDYPFAFLFFAVLVSAWYGGFGPAVAATFLGAVASILFLLPPHGGFFPEKIDHQLGLALFMIVGLGIAALGGRMRASLLRAHAGAALARRQREELRTTLASIGDGVIVTDAEGQVISLNAVAESLTGWTTGEAAGQPLEAVFVIRNERTRRAAENPVARALREGTVVGLGNHTVLLRRNGVECPIDDSASPIKDRDGQILGVVLIFRDVTERKRAEEASHRLAAIVESSQDAIVSKTPDGTIVSWNHGAEQLYGYSAEEILGKPFSLLVPPDRSEELEGYFRRLERGERIELFETVRQRKDGSRVPVSVSYSPLRDGTGHVVGAAVITRDVTDRKRAEEAARDHARHLQFIADNAPVLIAHCDAGQRFQFVNKPYAARFGMLPRDLVGRTIPEVLGEEAYAAIEPHVAAALSGRHVEFEVEIPYRDLGLQLMQCAYEPEFDEAGRVVGYVAAVVNVTERRQVERELREVEARFAAIVHHSPACIFVKDRQGRYLLANSALARLVGCRPEDFLDKTDADFFPPEVAEQFGRDDAEIFDTGRSRTFEETFPFRGERQTALTVKFALRDTSGAIYGVCGIATDVSNLKRTEEALRESAERLRLSLEAGRMGVWDWNLGTNEVKWSDNLEAIHGLAPGTFGGTFESFTELVHPADLAAVHQVINRCLETRSNYEVEYRTVWPDGTVHWLSGKGKVFAADGQPVRMIGVCQDITAPKRVEQDVRFVAEASATLAALVDYESTLQKVARLAVPSFADWCTVDMRDDNEALRRLAVAHVDPSRVELARELHRRFPPDPDSSQGVWGILHSGKSQLVAEITEDMLAKRVKDGEMMRILKQLGLRSYLGVPLRVRGKVLGVITFIAAESGRRYDAADLAVAEDLAHRAAVAIENARLYQEVREADRKKDEFLAVLGHELRNPLAPISNALHVLRLPGVSEEVLGQARDMMERQVQHMVRLVDDLLDVSRIVRGKIELRREPVELAAIVARAVETSQPLIDAEAHAFSVSLPPEPLWVNGDVVRLAQVVSNLLNNAARYTEPGGRIEIRGGREGDQAVLRVRDTGSGIPAEMLPRIFDLFVQADRRMKGAQGGMGIGLTLARSLVELHGGTVEARSAGLGQGSEFIVTLPLMPMVAENERPGPGTAPPDAGVPRRILVVDDNVDAAESLALLLRLRGHEVRVAHDGPSALRLAEGEPPELAFLDIGMPLMDGYDLARRFREQPALKEVRLIALTGWGQEEDRRRTREAGFDAHEVKPLETASLDRLLGQPLGNPV